MVIDIIMATSVRELCLGRGTKGTFWNARVVL